MEHGDALEVFALRAEQFDFAREELLVEHREMDVLFDALQAAHAGAEVVDFAAQDAPEFLAAGAAREFLSGGEGFAVARGVAGDGDVCRSRLPTSPSGMCLPRLRSAREIEAPADGGGIAEVARDAVRAGARREVEGFEEAGFGGTAAAVAVCAYRPAGACGRWSSRRDSRWRSRPDVNDAGGDPFESASETRVRNAAAASARA